MLASHLQASGGGATKGCEMYSHRTSNGWSIVRSTLELKIMRLIF